MKKLSMMGWALAVCLLFLGGQALASTVKIGVVDMQQILNESDAGKKAKEAFTKAVEEKQKELTTKEAALKKLKEELEKKGAAMNPALRKKKETTFQQQMAEFQQLAQTMQMTIAQEEEKMAAPIITAVLKMVQDKGKEEKYTLILEKNRGQILYIAEGVELTEEVIKKYNTQPQGAAPENK
jgi:outer membrane protein